MAMTDGCSPIGAFFRVILPNSVPGLGCGRDVLPHLRVERLLLRVHTHLHRNPAFAGLNSVAQLIRDTMVVAVSIRIDFGCTIGLRRGYC